MSELPDDIAALLATEREIPPAPAPVRERIAMRLALSRRRARMQRIAIASIALAAAAALVFAVWPRPYSTSDGPTGQFSAREAREIKLGDRAVAHVTAGAELMWWIDNDGGTLVEQRSGNVVYTVEHGAPFVVATAAAEVTVHGTVFRIEVDPMRTSKLKRAGLGVAVAGAILVTVYEGRVLVANDRGGITLGKNDRALAQPGQAPARVDDGDPRNVARVQQDADPKGSLRLEGQVLAEDDAPIGGVKVTVNSHPARVVTTEADGSFAFDELLPQPYELSARHGALYAGPVTARLTAGSEPVILRMRRGGALDVAVVDDQKQPLAGATVSVQGDDVTAGADGVAHFEGFGAGWYTITASATGFGPSYQQLQLGGTGVERRTIQLARGAPVSGIVLGPDGAPVAGASVRATTAAGFFGATVADTTTDASGAFKFAALAAGTYRFAAANDKHAPGLSAPEILDGTTARTGVTVKLGAGARIAGHVVTAAGAAAPYATIRVVSGTFAFPTLEGPTIRQARADALGAFEIVGLPRHDAELQASLDDAVSAPKKLELTVRTEVLDLQIKLDVDGVIAGIVVDGRGQPVADAQVTAQPDEPMEPEQTMLRDTIGAVTDQGGRFELHGLAAGTWWVSAARPNELAQIRTGRPERHGTAVAAGKRDARIRLDEPATIKGVVKLADGRSPGAFTVTVGDGAASSFAAADGTFAMREVPPGKHRVEIRGAFVPHEIDDVVVEPGATADLGTISVARGRTVRGRVVDTAGVAVVGAKVLASPILVGGLEDEISTGSSALTNADGTYEIAGLAATQLAIAARHGSEVAAARTIAPGKDDLRMDFTLAKAGSIEGRVTRGGEPVTAIVTAQLDNDVLAMHTTQSGPDGSYRFDNVPAGAYKLNATLPGKTLMFGAVSTPLARADVKSGATARADIAIAGVNVSVDVRGANGKPVAAMVHLVEGPAPASAAELAKITSSERVHTAPIVLDTQPHTAELTGITAGSYSACAQTLPSDPMVVKKGHFDTAALPMACSPITVAPAPERQRFTIAAPAP